MNQTIENQCVNAIRVLSADAVEKAKSGHPGLPLGAAAMAYELWGHHMNHNPQNPLWENRDRFVLSGGHGSMLLYSLLHLFGYGLTKEDLASFRQENSLTPGHPEYGHTTGGEATTGPLGAGMGMAVGMAMAEAHLSAVFNRPFYPVVDHYTYVLGGDGCMMEGISSEAFSLAGTLGLGKLIVLYDSNRISIEGSTDMVFTEDVQKRMEAFGFQTITVDDGNDLQAIGAAIEAARSDRMRPSFITVKTKIGWGCPAKEGKASAHGEPLGKDNVTALKVNLGWDNLEAFYVPQEVYDHCGELAKEGGKKEGKWNAMFCEYKKAYPDLASLWERYHDKEAGKKAFDAPEYWAFDQKPEATRNLSGLVINRLKDMVPSMVGGAADLSPSTKTYMKGEGDFRRSDYTGRNLHFGVRELAMAAVANGMALCGLRPFVSTFFVFSDYVKPMARLSALMKLPVTYVFTHDSIGLGEDGPTHEPIEQLAMLRAMPGFHVFRPADAKETAAAWYYAITAQNGPTALVLTRQSLPQLEGSGKEALKGGYILKDSEKAEPDGIIMASGSEVSLAVEARELLAREGIDVRVVSMPSMDVFEEQDREYRETVLPIKVRARVAVEALSDFGWGKYTGLDGACVAMTGFGQSAPAGVLFKKFGFTAENVAETMKAAAAFSC